MISIYFDVLIVTTSLIRRESRLYQLYIKSKISLQILLSAHNLPCKIKPVYYNSRTKRSRYNLLTIGIKEKR